MAAEWLAHAFVPGERATDPFFGPVEGPQAKVGAAKGRQTKDPIVGPSAEHPAVARAELVQVSVRHEREGGRLRLGFDDRNQSLQVVVVVAPAEGALLGSGRLAPAHAAMTAMAPSIQTRRAWFADVVGMPVMCTPERRTGPRLLRALEHDWGALQE